VIALPVGDADAHRRRLRQAERDHEGDRGPLQRDAVGGELDGADPAHQQRRHGEQADFGKDGDADRQAEPDDLQQKAFQSGRQKRTKIS
jgi:hypothetical protein